MVEPMKQALAFLVALALPAPAPAQTPDSHVESGGFKQPTPADRFRQDPTRDNLVHPPGYVTAPPGVFGEVAELGDGDVPVILLAGLGPGWRVFDAFIDANRADHRFHAVTLAGYGGSSAPPMPADGTSFGDGSWLQGSRDALAGLIEERSLERPVIVAFYSDAARIALRLCSSGAPASIATSHGSWKRVRITAPLAEARYSSSNPGESTTVGVFSFTRSGTRSSAQVSTV